MRLMTVLLLALYRLGRHDTGLPTLPSRKIEWTPGRESKATMDRRWCPTPRPAQNPSRPESAHMIAGGYKRRLLRLNSRPISRLFPACFAAVHEPDSERPEGMGAFGCG